MFGSKPVATPDDKITIGVAYVAACTIIGAVYAGKAIRKGIKYINAIMNEPMPYSGYNPFIPPDVNEYDRRHFASNGTEESETTEEPK